MHRRIASKQNWTARCSKNNSKIGHGRRPRHNSSASNQGIVGNIDIYPCRHRNPAARCRERRVTSPCGLKCLIRSDLANPMPPMDLSVINAVASDEGVIACDGAQLRCNLRRAEDRAPQVIVDPRGPMIACSTPIPDSSSASRTSVGRPIRRDRPRRDFNGHNVTGTAADATVGSTQDGT